MKDTFKSYYTYTNLYLNLGEITWIIKFYHKAPLYFHVSNSRDSRLRYKRSPHINYMLPFSPIEDLKPFYDVFIWVFYLFVNGQSPENNIVFELYKKRVLIPLKVCIFEENLLKTLRDFISFHCKCSKCYSNSWRVILKYYCIHSIVFILSIILP